MHTLNVHESLSLHLDLRVSRWCEVRREEGAASQRLERANKSLTLLQEKLLQLQHGLTVAQEASETLAAQVAEAAQGAAVACESFAQVGSRWL